MKKLYGKLLVMGFAAAVCTLAASAEARVTGVCSDCHTMHNSQNGKNMQYDDSSANPIDPERALTRGNCIGCHSSATGDTKNGSIPIVWNTTEPTYGAASGGTNSLAGGNFYWVTAADAKGHNVTGVKAADGQLSFTPPGWIYDATFAPTGGSAVKGSSGNWISQLTCAGTLGCHGKHAAADDFTDISGAHHADDATLDGSSVGKSYRFLIGVAGQEDADWEQTNGAADHNYYKGVGRASDELASVDKSTISFLCAECHGNFHSGAGTAGIDDGSFGAAWLRHPVDFDLNNATGTEYAAYTTYNVEAPVATNNLANAPGDATQAGRAIVTCVSCHRAHGSKWDDLLRWDYSTMNAHNAGANAGKGCFACHTTKDDA